MQNSLEICAHDATRVRALLVVAAPAVTASGACCFFERRSDKGDARMVRKFDNYIDGKWVPSSGSTIEVTNPASHDLLALVRSISPPDMPLPT